MEINLSSIKRNRIYGVFILLTFLIYGSAINNEYAIDDNIVVEGIEKVEKGMRGVKEIFTTHYAKDKDQSYGYRPLVLLSYAIEKELFRGLPASQSSQEKKKKDKLTQANVSHFVNVCLYALTCLLLFNFLTQVLSQYNMLIPLLVVLLFLVHPLHTEPVANIKSRDELFVFIGILLSLINYLKFAETNRVKYLGFAILFTVLSLLSKKSALAVLGLIPVILYFKNIPFKKIAITSLSIVIPVIMVLLIRRGLISDVASRDIMFHENPITGIGSFVERIGLASVSALFYLKMLVFPYYLSFYYGFNQIEMPQLTSLNMWVSIIFYLSLGIYGVIKFLKRDLLGLGIVWWFGVMLGVVNLIFPIVGIVADRFTYIFSLGFCIVVITLLVKGFKIKVDKTDVRVKLPLNFLILFSLIIVFSSFRVVKRNADWENYLTLFRNDVKHLDKSVKANAMLGDYLYRELEKEKNPVKANAIFNEMEQHYLKALSIYPEYFSPNNNLGTAYFTYKGDLELSKKYFTIALDCDSSSLITRFNLARTYELLGEIRNAEIYYSTTIKKSLEQKEDINLARSSYSYMGMMTVKQNNIQKAFEMYKNAVNDFPDEPEFNFYLANIYLAERDSVSAIKYYERALELNPSNKNISLTLDKLR